jgi:hypothetical protein
MAVLVLAIAVIHAERLMPGRSAQLFERPIVGAA